MKLTAVCSVAAASDVPAIRLLREALDVHHAGVRLTVAALPGAVRPLAAIAGVEVVAIGDLAAAVVDEPRRLPAGTALALARPLLLEQLLETGAPSALLLAADCDVRAPLRPIEAALDRSDVIALARIDGRLPDDGERPDAHDLLAAGEVDDELVAVRAGGAAARCLSWWLEQVVGAAGSGAGAGGGRVLPSVLRAAERALPGVELLSDAGCGLSAWNLHARPLSRGGDRLLRAAGQPVCLVRFDGFRPDRPWWLAEDASRVRVLDDPLLAQLCRERAAALIAAGWARPLRGHEPAGALAGDERVRRLLRDAADVGEEFGDLGTAEGEAALLSWLAEPAPVAARLGLNRYTHDLWCARDDVRGAYPDLDGADGERFVAWLWAHGRSESQLDVRLLPPAPDAAGGRTAPAGPNGRAATVDAVAPVAPVAGGGVEVVGYLHSTLGLGQAARSYVAALQAAGVPTATRAVTPPRAGRALAVRRRPELPDADARLRDGARAETLLVCVNAPELPGLVAQLGEQQFAGRRVIGEWAWETDVVPPEWDAAFELVDEVWVCSAYIAGILAPVSPKPVVVVPLAVTAPAEVAEQHGLALPPGDFTFLFAFDLFSTLERKNPLGLIAAFRSAFAPGEGPRLIVKTEHARLRPEAFERLRHAAGGRADIAIVDATLAPAQLAALFAQADCYVSLHRSEGFGLTLAEAMILGKPVIATGYGGNLDFMSRANAHLVDFTPTLVGDDCEHYPANGTWAEPSVEHAAELMREVWRDPAAARELGVRAHRQVAAQLDPRAVGAIAQRRLERLSQRRAAASIRSGP